MVTLEQGLENLKHTQEIERQIRRLEVRAAYDAQWHATRTQRRHAHNRGMALEMRNQNAFDIGESLAAQIYFQVQKAMPRRDMSEYKHVPAPEIKEAMYKKYRQMPVTFPNVSYSTLERMAKLASKHATKYYLCDVIREEIKRRDAIHDWHELQFDHLEALIAGGDDDNDIDEIKADHTHHLNAMLRVLKTGYENASQLYAKKKS